MKLFRTADYQPEIWAWGRDHGMTPYLDRRMVEISKYASLAGRRIAYQALMRYGYSRAFAYEAVYGEGTL